MERGVGVLDRRRGTTHLVVDESLHVTGNHFEVCELLVVMSIVADSMMKATEPMAGRW
jgi:hypothetical protein